MNAGSHDTDSVFVACYEARFRWYMSDVELWVLDWRKWRQDFLDAGDDVPEEESTDRFGIPIVDESTAAEFLEAMEGFRVDKRSLLRDFIARMSSASSSWDVLDLLPVAFVDFDHKQLFAFYPQGIALERYVPDGWKGEFIDFVAGDIEAFPKSEKYWINEGHDMLGELIDRGRTLGGL